MSGDTGRMGARLNTVGKKLLFGVALPILIVALIGVGLLWHEVDTALLAATDNEAWALSELVSTTFELTDAAKLKQVVPRAASSHQAHRSVAEAVRSDWRMFQHVGELRIVDLDGIVRWSRDVEEEGKPFPQAARLLAPGPLAVSVEGGFEVPFMRGHATRAEVIRPLGGIACAGCHAGERTMRLGVLHLKLNEPALRRDVVAMFSSALLILLVFTAALSAATAFSLRVFLTRPLRRLANAMRRAEEGDFLARAPVDRNDELGALAAAFNRMLVRITAMKAEEIDTHRDLAAAHEQLVLKQALESSKAKLENRVTELSTLYDVSRSLTSTLQLDELLGRVGALVPKRLQIPQFSIMLLNAEGKLEVKTAYPSGRGTEGICFSLGEGACGRAAQTRKSLYVGDLEADADIFFTRPGATKRSGSLLAIPMVHGERLLGVLNLERPEKAGFSPEEIDFLTTVADQVALAVTNAQLHQKTVELSITDPLTGVPNRRHLFSRLELEIARANRFGNQLSMLMVDIDHFKHLNDAAGHRAGDMVLRQVCELMMRMVRRVDTVARYGGEEFVILLPQVTKLEAIEVAEKLRRAIESAPLEHARAQPGERVTISIGVSNLPVDSAEQDELVDCADSALYASKRGGRNKVTGYSTGMELHPGRERGPYAAKRLRADDGSSGAGTG